MARPPVRRQLPTPNPSTTLRTSTTQATPPPSSSSTSTTPNNNPLPTSSSSSTTNALGPAFSTTPSSVRSTSSTSSVSSSSTSTSSLTTPPFPTDSISSPDSGQNQPPAVTQTSSPIPSTSSGSSETTTKGKSFLENKPLSGFVFGLAGLAALILIFIVVTSFVRRRNRKRLLADASNFSFDPKDVEDGTSEEKHSRSNLVGQHNAALAFGDYPPDNRVVTGFAGVGTGGMPRHNPHSPPMPTYGPQDYVGYDGGHPAQYHNMGNISIGYAPTPNPYDMYDPRTGGGYLNGQGRHDSWASSGPNGHNYPMTEPGPLVPRQLQPGVRPPQGPTLAPYPPNSTSPPLNGTPPIPQTSPPPTYLQPSTPNQKDLPILPTPGELPDAFGPRESADGFDDDAYGGAFLGPESPVHRTLQVANM